MYPFRELVSRTLLPLFEKSIRELFSRTLLPFSGSLFENSFIIFEKSFRGLCCRFENSFETSFTVLGTPRYLRTSSRTPKNTQGLLENPTLALMMINIQAMYWNIACRLCDWRTCSFYWLWGIGGSFWISSRY